MTGVTIPRRCQSQACLLLARLGPAEVLAIRQLSGGKRTDLSATHSLAS